MEQEGKVPSVTDLDEAGLAEFLFSDYTVRRLVLWGLGFPPSARVAHRVGAPFIQTPSDRPGDIDVIVCEPSTPHLATAIECKRVKVRADTFQTGQANKLHELQRGAAQAIALLRLGFHRTYLLVCIAVDGSQRAGYNFTGRGLTPELIRAIYEQLPWNALDERVGVLAIEVVQPTEEGISRAGGIGLPLLRLAAPQDQSAELTALVSDYPAACTPAKAHNRPYA